MHNIRLTIHKLKHWEYWPVWIIYLPCFFQYLYYAVRSKTALFFTAANPGMINGGAFYVPKSRIYDLLPEAVIPKTLQIEPSVRLDQIRHWMNEEQLNYPILLKPDHGLRGLGLVIIRDEPALEKLIEQLPSTYLVQEFVDFPKEMGIFFIKDPNNGQISITSVVEKEFMRIMGNGVDTVEQLILSNNRYALQYDKIIKKSFIPMDLVLEKGEVYKLEPIGNHSRGAVFYDGNNHDVSALQKFTEAVLSDIAGVYYGRLDIKYDNAEDLYKQKSFKVIELNGAFSEPAHIYDPSYSIWNAWKELIRHFKILFDISQYQLNHGFKPMKLKEGLRLMSVHFRVVKELSKLS